MNLEEAIRQAGFETQREFAHKLATDQAQVSRWIKGVKPMKLQRREIVRVLRKQGVDVTAEELWPVQKEVA